MNSVNTSSSALKQLNQPTDFGSDKIDSHRNAIGYVSSEVMTPQQMQAIDEYIRQAIAAAKAQACRCSPHEGRGTLSTQRVTDELTDYASPEVAAAITDVQKTKYAGSYKQGFEYIKKNPQFAQHVRNNPNTAGIGEHDSRSEALCKETAPAKYAAATTKAAKDDLLFQADFYLAGVDAAVSAHNAKPACLKPSAPGHVVDDESAFAGVQASGKSTAGSEQKDEFSQAGA